MTADTATRPAFGRSRAVPAETPAVSTSSGGWGGYKKVATSDGSYLKIDEERQLILILDAEPFDYHSAHWLDFITEGTKSVICWDSLLDANFKRTMDRCPLCLAGDKATSVTAFFNVITLKDPSCPSLAIWEAKKSAADQLREYSEDNRYSPINRRDIYFEVSKVVGAKNRVTYKVQPQKARDLEEDWGVKPLTAEAIDELSQAKKTGRVKEPFTLERMVELAELLD